MDIQGMFGGLLETSDQYAVAIALAIGYPIVVLALLEVARNCGATRPQASDMLRQAALLLLPAAALFLILRKLAGLPLESWMVRSAATAFGITGLYLLLRIAQAALMLVIDDRDRAPKLLFDVLRIGLSLVWGAVIVSRIWDVNLAQLFAAMGVGSIVLAFALQEFLGNLLSGLGLLSAQKFGIGDWIRVDGASGRVTEMDWRTVTLVRADGARVVVANSTLAKGNLIIDAKAHEAPVAMVTLSFGLDIPPEEVRAAVLEAGRGIPSAVAAGGLECFVSAINHPVGSDQHGVVTYKVRLPVPDPGAVMRPTDAFLSRFWYVAQRRGLRLSLNPSDEALHPPDQEARLHMLALSRALHGDADAQARIAQASSFRRYRHGDVLVAPGQVTTEAVMVLAGSLAMSVRHADHEMRIEQLGKHRLMVLHETLDGLPSPVRVIADSNADVLAIPAAALLDVMARNPLVARDVNALAEARRLAVNPPDRRLRGVA